MPSRQRRPLQVEPEHFVPLLPVLLINGSQGIGTGWSTNVWPYHPLRVLEASLDLLHGRVPKELVPWAKGFRGKIELDAVAPGEEDPQRFISTGVATRTAAGLEISELPLRTWIQSKVGGGYKGWILKTLKETDDCLWSGFSEAHTGRHVHFSLRMNEAQRRRVEAMSADELETAFKLNSSHTLSNMHAFDGDGHLRRFKSPLNIVETFLPVRLRTFELRKMHQLEAMRREWELKTEQARFIELVADGGIETFRTQRAVIIEQLQRHNFAPQLGAAPIATEAMAAEAERAKSSPYQHLLGMRIDDLGLERMDRLRRQCDSIKAELDTLRITSATQLYERELEELRPLLEERCAEDS